MNRHGIFTRLIACMLILLLVVPAIAEAASSFKAEVYSSSMKVYESASTKKKVDTLKKGTALTVVWMQNGWCAVTYKGGKGFCQVKDIKATSNKLRGYTNKQVAVYKTASSSKKMDTLFVDYPLYIVGESGRYYLVEDPLNKATGYVLKTAMSPTRQYKYEVKTGKTNYTSSSSRTNMDRIPSLKSGQFSARAGIGASRMNEFLIYVGQCKLGCRYLSSGANNTTTFSNYSFVKSCFAACGYTLPGSIRSIANASQYTGVTRNNLKRGDIVCLNCDATDGEAVDHIGIYIGSGYFLHASAAAGCVVVSSLNSTYYKNSFCWGRRVIK